ncbi:unnamed protein product [Larinioides sclopetarius]|uniref:Membrane-bound transcription factor site-2 protease n=1 Tax=Larinioides sclopetarius TaxID=280406 RepID=A0AAV1YRL5_9ARAC
MSNLLFIGSIVIIFGIIYFLDLIFKSCMLFPYIKFLHDTGLVIKPLTICWETTQLNRPFMRCGSIKPVCLRRWFQVGAFIVSLSVIPALCILFVPVLQFLSYDDSTPILMPIIPGLNLPYSQLLHYSLSLFICVTFHEFGHALAASREKVPIEGFGLAIFGIFPIAYVRMSVEHLRQMNVSQQLRIYAAGIWHNLVLAAVALALVSASPFILKPMYQQGNGVTVIDVKQDSGLGQKGGLMVNDVIIGVDECLIRTENDWKLCINQEYAKLQSGFCVHETFYKKEDISIKKNGTSSNCCPETSRNMCFSFSDPNLDELMCLPARKLAEDAKMCVDNQDCWQELCLIPVLDSDSERFLRIKVSSRKAVFYVGRIEEVFSSVAVSPWVSEYAAVYYVDMYELFIGYPLMKCYFLFLMLCFLLYSLVFNIFLCFP